MANIGLLLLVALVAWYVVSFLRRHGHGIVARRGLSIGADLGTLADQPRVRVRAVTSLGANRVQLILRPETGLDDGPSVDLDLVVSLDEEEFGFDLLHQWQQSQGSLAIVMPPGSRIVRLRSIDDLQPLTLRRLDED